MILTIAKYDENLLKDSTLSLLFIVKFFSPLETLMILKTPNETFLRITWYNLPKACPSFTAKFFFAYVIRLDFALPFFKTNLFSLYPHRKPNPKMPKPYVVKFWPETWASKPHYWHFYEREEVEESTYDQGECWSWKVHDAFLFSWEVTVTERNKQWYFRCHQAIKIHHEI